MCGMYTMQVVYLVYIRVKFIAFCANHKKVGAYIAVNSDLCISIRTWSEYN